MIVTITREARQAVLTAAIAAGAEECCGLLLGRPGQVAAALPAVNVAADPARNFEIDPAMLLRTYRAARAAGQQIVGHYHSHPDGSPQPSRRDAARATQDGQIWLIAAGDTVTAWAAIAADSAGDALYGRFRPVDLAVQ